MVEALVKLVTAITPVLWPVFAFTALFVFRPALMSMLETFRLRKVTLKVGGQELTLDEIKQQESKDIADLRIEIVALKKALNTIRPQPGRMAVSPEPTTAKVERPRKILWVDDNPRNNSSFVQQLNALGIDVEIAVATGQAKRMFETYSYDFIISDMSRNENGTVHPKAGMDFLKWVRSGKSDIPFIFFCSPRAAREHAIEAKGEGANGITASVTELFGLLELNEDWGSW